MGGARDRTRSAVLLAAALGLVGVGAPGAAGQARSTEPTTFTLGLEGIGPAGGGLAGVAVRLALLDDRGAGTELTVLGAFDGGLGAGADLNRILPAVAGVLRPTFGASLVVSGTTRDPRLHPGLDAGVIVAPMTGGLVPRLDLRVRAYAGLPAPAYSLGLAVTTGLRRRARHPRPRRRRLLAPPRRRAPSGGAR